MRKKMSLMWMRPMKLKPIKQGPGDLCICGHKRSQHYQFIYEQDPILVAKLRKSHGSWFNEGASGCSVGEKSNEPEYCHCDKYIDRRHCKIKDNDPMLQYCMSEVYDITVTGAYYDKIASMATSSRRICLFKFLGMLVVDVDIEI